jgi:ABC-2 type transport system permease protein
MLLLRDELVGFARSRVMLVLWIVLPVLALLGYLFLPHDLEGMASNRTMTAITFMGILVSSVAGTVAALMTAVDIVSERNRNVYELFIIRPITRETIIRAKFVAVFVCVTVACIVSLLLGLVVDVVRHVPVTGAVLADAARSLASLTCVIALSTAVGALFGVMSRTIVVAVILVLYIGQNVAIVPMLPVYFGLMPETMWLFVAISVALTVILLWLAGLAFRRADV